MSELRKSPSGPEVQVPTIPVSSDDVSNESAIDGTTLTDVLDELAGTTPIATGAALTDADQTLTTAQRYVMLAGTTTNVRTKTITPPAAGLGFLIEIGTQAQNQIVVNGGPASGGLYTWTVVAGTKFALYFVSDGTDVILTAAIPLGAEPLL